MDHLRPGGVVDLQVPIEGGCNLLLSQHEPSAEDEDVYWVVRVGWVVRLGCGQVDGSLSDGRVKLELVPAGLEGRCHHPDVVGCERPWS